MWDWLDSGALVSDAYVAWPAGRPTLPWCYFGAGSPASHAAFIEWAAAMGRQLRPTYGVPVSVTVAQAILESGWGGSTLSTDGNSFFGMKCFGHPRCGGDRLPPVSDDRVRRVLLSDDREFPGLPDRGGLVRRSRPPAGDPAALPPGVRLRR